MCPSKQPVLQLRKWQLPEEPFPPATQLMSPGTEAGSTAGGFRPLQQTGQMEFSGGWARHSGKGHSTKAQELKGKAGQEFQAVGVGGGLSGIESRAVVPCGFQGVPRLRGTVTPADPSECVWTERQEEGAGWGLGPVTGLRPPTEKLCPWAAAGPTGEPRRRPLPSGDVPGKWQAPPGSLRSQKLLTIRRLEL